MASMPRSSADAASRRAASDTEHRHHQHRSSRPTATTTTRLPNWEYEYWKLRKRVLAGGGGGSKQSGDSKGVVDADDSKHHRPFLTKSEREKRDSASLPSEKRGSECEPLVVNETKQQAEIGRLRQQVVVLREQVQAVADKLDECRRDAQVQGDELRSENGELRASHRQLEDRFRTLLNYVDARTQDDGSESSLRRRFVDTSERARQESGASSATNVEPAVALSEPLVRDVEVTTI